MKKTIYCFLIISIAFIVFSCSDTATTVSTDTTTDTTSPVIAEVTVVTTPTATTTPNYIFSSTESGIITYGGSCSSSITSVENGCLVWDGGTGEVAIEGACLEYSVDNHSITFSTLDSGTTYSDCTIKVTDNSSNVSNTLSVTSFTIVQSNMGGSIQSGEELSLTGVKKILAGGTDGSEDGTGTESSFLYPSGITTDGTNLYVTDTDNHLIRKITDPFPKSVTSTTAVVTTLAGTGTSGSVDGTGLSSSFNVPEGITTDGTNLYVVDSGNYLIRKIVISTSAVTTLAGTGSRGSTDNTTGTGASFGVLYGITTDGTSLFVVDGSNNLIRKIVISTGAVTTLAGTGSVGSTDNTTGTSSSFSSPRGITTDGTNLYVADTGNHLIRNIVISTGAVTTLAGTGSSGSVDDNTGTRASFSSPDGIATDGTNLYVGGSQSIRQIVISTGAVTTLESTDTASGTSSVFSNLSAITTDGTNLYYLDSYNDVSQIR